MGWMYIFTPHLSVFLICDTWRRNAKDTSVVCIGEITHKVLDHEHITKADDTVSQRHEKLGTQRVYEYLEGFVNWYSHP